MESGKQVIRRVMKMVEQREYDDRQRAIKILQQEADPASDISTWTYQQLEDRVHELEARVEYENGMARVFNAMCQAMTQERTAIAQAIDCRCPGHEAIAEYIGDVVGERIRDQEHVIRLWTQHNGTSGKDHPTGDPDGYIDVKSCEAKEDIDRIFDRKAAELEKSSNSVRHELARLMGEPEETAFNA